MNHKFEHDVCVIGGCGHVGLPLGLVFADKGLKTVLYDINPEAIKKVSAGEIPFMEEGAEEALKRAINKNLKVSSDIRTLSKCKYLAVVIGTPIDEHLNPEIRPINRLFDDISPHLSESQHIVLRSTVYPNITEKIYKRLEALNKDIRVSFCPERIAEGKAMTELKSLPQIVGGFDEITINEAAELFQHIAGEVVILTPLEAELAKLFTNSWRYIQFAIANQFYMLADRHNVDFYKIFDAIKHNYPRAKDFPSPGFTAGPCLFKDTMQISAFSDNIFFLGQAAMMVNEGVPNYIVEKLKREHSLKDKTVGVLGMAFKGEIDDTRDSLSYKLKKILELEAKETLCADEYVKRDGITPLDIVLKKSDILILGAPHKAYKNLKIDKDKTLVDIWNFIENPWG